MRRHIKRVWDSPTFTSWGNKGSQSLRLLILLPLILAKFDEVQIAAWLLFGSLFFVNEIILAQTSVLFSRMIALAMGGVNDLSPILSNSTRSTTGSPNWLLVSRVYQTVKSLNLGLAFLSTLVTLLLGWFAFGNLLENYDAAREVWSAFSIMLIGRFFQVFYKRYAIALRGLGKVALTNRWEALFSIISAVSGSIALLMGASIVGLAIVVQLFVVIGVVRLWFLLTFIVEPRFRKMRRSYHIDREIICWAWPPLWRGIVQMVANKGSAKICIILLARFADAATLSSVLLVLRLLETVQNISTAPLGANVPRFAKMLGGNEVERFRKSVIRSLKISIWLVVLGTVCGGFALHMGLILINSEVEFIGFTLYVAISAGVTMVSFQRLFLIIPLIGNRVMAVPQYINASLISVIIALPLVSNFGIGGFIFASYLPVILIVNWIPVDGALNMIQMSRSTLLKNIIGFAPFKIKSL